MDGSDLASIAAVIDFHIPQFTPEQWLQVAILVISLFLCAMASAAETALTSISRIKLKNLVESGDEQAIEIDRLLTNPNKLLSTILVVNSVAVIVASSMATVDRKSTRLNSSHRTISYAVFCLKKKKK